MPLRVLLIDDDDDLRVEILEYLRRRRHDVTGCASIAEAGDAVARQIAAAQPPQAVICDLHLADGNGVDFYLETAPKLGAARWLLMSGDADTEALSDRIGEFGRRFEFHIVEKPVSLRVLNDMLEGRPPAR
jgi:DNA-binding NtrC family response regulator